VSKPEWRHEPPTYASMKESYTRDEAYELMRQAYTLATRHALNGPLDIATNGDEPGQTLTAEEENRVMDECYKRAARYFPKRRVKATPIRLFPDASVWRDIDGKVRINFRESAPKPHEFTPEMMDYIAELRKRPIEYEMVEE